MRTRQKIKEFLQANPGWHDSFAVASAVGVSKPAAMNQCECLRSVRLVEVQKQMGRNQYRWIGGEVAIAFTEPGRPLTGHAKVKVTIRLPQELVDWIDKKGERTTIITEILEKVYKDS